MDINSVDLNLLKIFDAVYTEGNVSRAAVRLGLTQPSVSHGLTRLRRMFSDPLFVRAQTGVSPTVVAHRVAATMRHALRDLQTMLDEQLHFDPKLAKRSLRLYMSDFGSVVFLPDLMRELRERAPGVTVEISQLTAAELPRAMESGQIDLAIGYLPSLSGDMFQSEALFAEEYVRLTRVGDPGKPNTAEDATDYIAVTSHPQTVSILREAGLEERVQLWLPHFMVLPAVLAKNDFAVLLPRNVAEVFGLLFHHGRYSITPAPGAPFAMTICLYWHRRYGSDPGNQWLRNLMIQLFKHAMPDQRTGQGPPPRFHGT